MNYKIGDLIKSYITLLEYVIVGYRPTSYGTEVAICRGGKIIHIMESSLESDFFVLSNVDMPKSTSH